MARFLCADARAHGPTYAEIESEGWYAAERSIIRSIKLSLIVIDVFWE